MTPTKAEPMAIPDVQHTPDMDKVGAVSAVIVAILSFLKINVYRKGRLKQIQEALEKHALETKQGFTQVGERIDKVHARIGDIEHRNEMDDFEARILRRLQDSNETRRGT